MRRDAQRRIVEADGPTRVMCLVSRPTASADVYDINVVPVGAHIPRTPPS